ncbi:MAG TPA: hypothetical protein VIM63_17275, partial [Rhodoferax sp.]
MTSASPRGAGPQLHIAPVDVQPILGLAKLVRLRTTELHELMARAHASPDLAHTCMQMFHLLIALDQRDFALEMQAKALALRVLYRMAGPEQP